MKVAVVDGSMDAIVCAIVCVNALVGTRNTPLAQLQIMPIASASEVFALILQTKEQQMKKFDNLVAKQTLVQPTCGESISSWMIHTFQLFQKAGICPSAKSTSSPM